MKISKEQKEAIEYYQNKEVSLSVDFDTENLLKALGITEEDSFENHQIRFKTLLNLIEKLQKENKKYKQFFDFNTAKTYFPCSESTYHNNPTITYTSIIN